MAAAKKSGTGKITDILIRNNVIDEASLLEAEEDAKSNGARLERYLVEKELVPGAEMAIALSEYLGMPPISLTRFTPDNALIRLRVAALSRQPGFAAAYPISQHARGPRAVSDGYERRFAR